MTRVKKNSLSKKDNDKMVAYWRSVVESDAYWSWALKESAKIMPGCGRLNSSAKNGILEKR